MLEWHNHELPPTFWGCSTWVVNTVQTVWAVQAMTTEPKKPSECIMLPWKPDSKQSKTADSHWLVGGNDQPHRDGGVPLFHSTVLEPCLLLLLLLVFVVVSFCCCLFVCFQAAVYSWNSAGIGITSLPVKTHLFPKKIHRQYPRLSLHRWRGDLSPERRCLPSKTSSYNNHTCIDYP